MLYDNYEMILFSLIYSDIQNGKFPKPYLSHKALYGIFKESIEQNINFFKLRKYNEIESFLFLVVNNLKKEKKIREIEKYFEELKLYFIKDTTKLNRLRSKIFQEIELCKLYNINYKTYFSDDYPINLKKLPDPPFVIYYQGNFPIDDELKRSLAIVGTRQPSKNYGEKIAEKVGTFLAKKGWWNISGLAIGCDEFGHKGSLNFKGMTGAILGHGLAQATFPNENDELSKEIIKNKGFLMSELPPSIKLSPLFLILRNRLQSGLTRGIFVVETSHKSGTLHTIKYALEQNKIVYILDLSSIKDSNISQKASGNLILLNKEIGVLSPNIPKKYFSNIVGIKSIDCLKHYIDEIEKKTVKKEEFKQINLFENN